MMSWRRLVDLCRGLPPGVEAQRHLVWLETKQIERAAICGSAIGAFQALEIAMPDAICTWAVGLANCAGPEEVSRPCPS